MASLSDFFNVVVEAKIQKEEEFKSLVGDNFFDEIFNEQLKPHKTPEQLAKKHNVTLPQIKNQLKKGTKVEREHTKNIELAISFAQECTTIVVQKSGVSTI